VDIQCINGYLDSLTHFGQVLKPVDDIKAPECPVLRDEGGNKLIAGKLDKDFTYFPTTCSLNTFKVGTQTEVDGKKVSFESLFNDQCKGKEGCKLTLPT